jgi:hypothetical protein
VSLVEVPKSVASDSGDDGAHSLASKQGHEDCTDVLSQQNLADLA